MENPKIRFKGFTKDWEQRKFSELVTIERGGSPRPIYFLDYHYEGGT